MVPSIKSVHPFMGGPVQRSPAFSYTGRNAICNTGARGITGERRRKGSRRVFTSTMEGAHSELKKITALRWPRLNGRHHLAAIQSVSGGRFVGIKLRLARRNC